MTKITVTLEHDDGTVETHDMTLPVKRAFFYTGPVAEMPEWFQDKIVPTPLDNHAKKEQSLEIGEVWTNWNKRRSLTIRGKNGYLVVDVGSIIVDRGNNVFQDIKLKNVRWGDDGTENPQGHPYYY